MLEGNLDPDVIARVIGVKAQMESFDYFLGIGLCHLVLNHSDNLSHALQNSKMSASEGQCITALTVDTLVKMRTDEAFHLFWDLAVKNASELDVSEPHLPRKRRRPAQFETGPAQQHQPLMVEDHYRPMYFEVLDLAVATIKRSFDQQGYAMYKTMENLLIKSARAGVTAEEFHSVTSSYGDDFQPDILEIQLGLLHQQMENHPSATLNDILEFLQGFSTAEQAVFSQIVVLVRLILVNPATNAISERSFSAMRRIKTYLRSTMGQSSEVNSVMLLNVHKDKTDELSLLNVANEFVTTTNSEHRKSVFGIFTEADLSAK